MSPPAKTRRATPLERLTDAHPVFVDAQGPRFPLRDFTDEERERHGVDRYGYAKYEEYPESEAPLVGRCWHQEDLDVFERFGGVRRGASLRFDCPIHEDCVHEIPFANPLDGWPAPSRHIFVGATWTRTGETFETLTLAPSIRILGGKGCHWHGFIRAGAFVNCADAR